MSKKKEVDLAVAFEIHLTLAELWTLERLVRQEHERASFATRPLLAKLEQKLHEVQP